MLSMLPGLSAKQERRPLALALACALGCFALGCDESAQTEGETFDPALCQRVAVTLEQAPQVVRRNGAPAPQACDELLEHEATIRYLDSLTALVEQGEEGGAE